MPYIGDEINELYQAADLVVSRSGAGTVGEICHYGKASLLVPLSLSSSRGDQILNAERLERKGAAVVLHDDADFLKIVRSLLEDEEKRSKLGEEARALATDDAAVKIAGVIKACMKR
jgi:UDP-N-acetylglucosamine--N-acetylmuramyl-(pentapeptide) pyrophosphoryl-undecaprenol N-acetylglucosamine transferase